MKRRDVLAVGAAAMGMSQATEAADEHAKMDDQRFMAPMGNHHLHFCGVHCAKKDPRIQIVTQHYCGPVGDGMHQCLLFDSVSKNARLLGVEYIISNDQFQKLSDKEKSYWHPHTYEVLAGGLIAPGMKPDDETTFMKALLTTWGKTWHTWPDPSSPIPIGEPLLMWSLTGDGQDDAAVFAARDKEFGVKTAEIRAKRIEAIGFEPPAVPAPKSIEDIGRQWTAAGEDKPTPKRK